MRPVTTLLHSLTLLLAMSILPPDLSAQTPPPDLGMSSPTHSTYAGKMAASGAVIENGKENPSAFRSSFDFGNPIYVRVYFARSLATEYAAEGWDYSSKTWYAQDVVINGELIGTFYNDLDPSWTTFRECWYTPDGADPSDEVNLIRNAIRVLRAGENTITCSWYLTRGENQPKSRMLAQGTLRVHVSQQQSQLVRQYALQGIRTRWSGNDAWREWVIQQENREFTLRTKWSGDDGWREWEFNSYDCMGTIRAKWSGDDGWREWELNSDMGSCTMRTRWSGSDGWREWSITGPDGTVNLRTRWSGNDGWREWVAEGDGNMVIRTRWSGDDGWREWAIEDHLNATPELKIGAMFCAIVTASVVLR